MGEGNGEGSNVQKESEAMKSEALKRCPFCGGEARLIHCCHGSKAECFDCEASTKYYLDGMDTNEESARKAAEAWNKRTS